MVNDIDIIHEATLSIIPSKYDSSPVVYGGEREESTRRRSLSSGGRGAPHTCNLENGNMPYKVYEKQNSMWE